MAKDNWQNDDVTNPNHTRDESATGGGIKQVEDKNVPHNSFASK
jgi:hypothetical protein